MARGGVRWFGHPGQLGLTAIVCAGIALLGFAVTTARAASNPVVRVYDVQVTGTFRSTLSLPTNPLGGDFAYSEVSKWTETYRGVRLDVQAPEFGDSKIEMRMSGKGKGTVTGSIEYSLSGPRLKSCALRSKRSEPGSLSIGADPYRSLGQGAVTYELHLSTGRSGNTPALPSSKCSYFAGNGARFSGTRVGSGGDVATGYIDSRRLTFAIELHTPREPGQLGFPLNRLHAGAGLVLALRGKTEVGRKLSEGTVRIRFVPRPA